MYACYTRSRVEPDAIRYRFKEEVALFGCVQGFIPWLLKKKLSEPMTESCRWHLDIRACLAEHQEYVDGSLLIDLKPKQNRTNLSLYEVLDVWGFSSNGWMPILRRRSVRPTRLCSGRMPCAISFSASAQKHPICSRNSLNKRSGVATQIKPGAGEGIGKSLVVVEVNAHSFAAGGQVGRAEALCLVDIAGAFPSA